MPYELEKFPTGYKVKNTQTGAYKSKRPIAKEKAEAQLRLLNAIDSGAIPPRRKAKPGDTVVRPPSRRNLKKE